MMNWQEISNNWVLFPSREPLAIIHFLGGAFLGSVPNVTYRWLLEELAKEGYCIVATPFEMSLDHQAISRNVLSRWESLQGRWQKENRLGKSYLPVYGIGHSMGCKLHLLMGSLHEIERAGNILIAFNNYPIKRAIPFFKELELDQRLNLEFSPSAEETRNLIRQDYQIRRNLLIYFDNDDIDQTLDLRPILLNRFPGMTAALRLPGTHLTPCSQDMFFNNKSTSSQLFQSTEKWLKQSLSRDLYRLKDEILIWLNPVRRVVSN